MADLNSLLASETATKDGTLPPEALPEPRSQGKLVLRKFLHHKLAMASTGVLVLIVLLSILLPIFWKHNYEDSSFPSFAKPSGDFPLGAGRQRRSFGGVYDLGPASPAPNLVDARVVGDAVEP